MKSHCPFCGKFLGNIKGSYNDFEAKIVKVVGTCATCGEFDITNSGDWCAEDFFPEKGCEEALK